MLVAHCCTIAARIGTAFEQSVLAVDADRLGMPKRAVPLADDLDRLSAQSQFPRSFVRDSG